MATAAQIEPAWPAVQVPVIHGLGDKRIGTGAEFETRPLGSFWGLEPSHKPKHHGLAFLPSMYHEHDAREHKAQRERGRFVTLVGDFDKGNHPIAAIEDFARQIVGAGAFLIHSTANAVAGDMRWRLILPLHEPIPFAAWRDAQQACFDLAKARSIEMDGVTERPGQVSFLPNVPAVHDKTGQALRDDAGPLFYAATSSSIDAPGLTLDTGAIADAIAAVRERRAEDERLRNELRIEAERRRAATPPSSDGSVIDAFNRSNPIADLLASYDYEQSRGDTGDWRSRYQTSGSYATRVIGDKWISLSSSDSAAGIGQRCDVGCYGDAYDLFVHYDHAGNRNSAWKQVCQEQGRERPRGAANMDSYSQPWPPVDPSDPGPQPWDETTMPHGASVHLRPGLNQITGDEIMPSRQPEPPAPLAASPYQWTPPESLPRRPWQYGRMLLRGSVFIIIAPGATGKTSLKIGTALALCTGRPLLGQEVWGGPKRVWIWNLEDSLADLRYSIQAAALHWGLTPDDLGDRLFVDSGLDGATLKLARRTPNGPEIDANISRQIREEITRREIDVLMIDPFISSHGLNDENDNAAIDMVAKEWSRIATATGSSIILAHHAKKLNGAEVTAESARGASSLVDAARGGLALNTMTKAEAESFGIPLDQRRRFFRGEDAKPNRAPPGSGQWFEMVSVSLGNAPDGGDNVGVATAWKAPDPFSDVGVHHLKATQAKIADGQWRRSDQAKDWAGLVVAEVLGLDVDVKAEKRKAKSVLETWIQSGSLCVELRPDKNGDERPFVVVGSVA